MGNAATFKEGNIYNVIIDPKLNRHRFNLIVTSTYVYLLNSWVGIFNLKDYMDRTAGYKFKKDAFTTLWGNFCTEEEKAEYMNKLFFPEEVWRNGAPLKVRDVHLISAPVTNELCKTAFGTTKKKLQEKLVAKLESDLLYIYKTYAK